MVHLSQSAADEKHEDDVEAAPGADAPANGHDVATTVADVSITEEPKPVDPLKPEFGPPHMSHVQAFLLFLRFGCLAVGGPVRLRFERPGPRHGRTAALLCPQKLFLHGRSVERQPPRLCSRQLCRRCVPCFKRCAQVAQIALMKDELVVQDKWMSPADFNKVRQIPLPAVRFLTTLNRCSLCTRRCQGQRPRNWRVCSA